MSFSLRATVASLALSATVVFSTGAASPRRLKYVVIVSRHGVRAPTWTRERLNEYSAEPWPDFGVPPGNLTAHGRTLMTLMGGYYGEWLSSEHLVDRTDCRRTRIQIWADTDERTLSSGKALAAGMLPSCEVPVHSASADETEPLFDPISAGRVVPDAAKALQAVRDRLGADPETLMNAHRPAFDRLQQILTGDGHAPKSVVSGAPIAVVSGAKSLELSGPFSAASTLTENLLLEYTNGFRGAQLGWGRLDAAGLTHVLELHTTYADLLRRTPYLARLRGSNLLSHVLDSMAQAVTGVRTPGALGAPGDAVLVLSGHDTNLSNISGMLGLTWSIPGYQRDDTPPGGALLLSVWIDGDGEPFVRTEYVVQTLDQMRDAVPVSMKRPPARVPVTIPACANTGSGVCSWESFARAVRAAVDPNLASQSSDPQSGR